MFLLAPLTCVSASGGTEPAALENPGFESNLDNWELAVYGAPAAAESDRKVKHGGSQALRIAATQPSDAAVGQEVRLKPRQWYRFAGWVKTAALEPRDARVCGTFQIQKPGGAGVIASGASHRGDTDWALVPLYFESPCDGRVRVAAFFAGYGKGTGTAWFGDLSLEPVQLAGEPVRLTREPLNGGAVISPYQYGQFLEYLCDSVPALWAEKLYDGSFEGLSPYNVAYLKETDFKEKPWYPSGATNRARYTLSADDPVNGRVAQLIDAAGDTPCVVGISQDGIAVQEGVACSFSCYLKADRLAGPVEVRLRHGGANVGESFRPEGGWRKFTARLVPRASDANATLTIRFTGPGRLWIDNASLMPEDAVGGWRRDAVEALRALKSGIIRFGGSAVDAPGYGDFQWTDTVGDPDRRKPFRAWGGLQKTGPGLEEFVRLCRAVGAEPMICVRTSGRTARDAADEVEYFNGAATTPMGARRAKNGHKEPYGVRYWQIGNERSGPAYEAQLAPFAAAMRKVDPTIRLLSSFPSEGTLRLAGDQLDYLCPHQYDVADLGGTEAELLAAADLIHRATPGAAGAAGAAPAGRRLRLAVTEWNTTAGDWGPGRAKLWTLENALAVARYHNLLHRHADLVEIANRSNLSNSFCSGILQTDNHRLYKTPAYYAQQLYATLAGDRPLRMNSAVPVNACPDFSATLSEDDAMLTLFAVNAGTSAIARPIDLSAWDILSGDAIVWTLADRERAGQPDVMNSFDDPERVSVAKAPLKVATGRFDYTFPPLSLTVVQVRVKP